MSTLVWSFVSWEIQTIHVFWPNVSLNVISWTCSYTWSRLVIPFEIISKCNLPVNSSLFNCRSMLIWRERDGKRWQLEWEVSQQTNETVVNKDAQILTNYQINYQNKCKHTPKQRTYCELHKINKYSKMYTMWIIVVVLVVDVDVRLDRCWLRFTSWMRGRVCDTRVQEVFRSEKQNKNGSSCQLQCSHLIRNVQRNTHRGEYNIYITQTNIIIIIRKGKGRLRITNTYCECKREKGKDWEEGKRRSQMVNDVYRQKRVPDFVVL